MGNSNTTQIAPLLDYQPVRNRSVEYALTEWEDIGTKNYAYYTGQRFCVIPPELYPNCVQGWLYGYSYNNTPITK